MIFGRCRSLPYLFRFKHHRCPSSMHELAAQKPLLLSGGELPARPLPDRGPVSAPCYSAALMIFAIDLEGVLAPEIWPALGLSLIHISEPTRLLSISYAVF